MDQKSVIFAGVSLLFLALLSCGQEPKKMEATLKDPELARRLAAVYAGEVPCADCEGIDYRLDLRPDFSYEARMIYKGKSEEPFEFSGAYAFTQDSIVVLEKETPGMNYFRIVPAGLISATLLSKRLALGYLLSSVLIVKGIAMLTAISMMIINMLLQGVDVSWIEMIIFLGFTLISFYTFSLLMKHAH